MANSNSVSPISFKVHPDDRKRIKADAKAAGMSRSTYIRSKLLTQPDTKPVYRRTQLRRLFMGLIGHLGKVGNNMNQIAWKLNSDQVVTPLDRQLHAEGIAALREMRVVVIDYFLKNGPC